MTINFWSKSFNYYFEGLCLSVKKKNLSAFNTSITLRNYLQQTGIEVTVAYYLYRLFLHTIISDYKRKKIWYRASKLYFVRNKENKASKINP
jgi:ribosomal protein L19